MMDLTCYELEPGRIELRPAPRRRGWMDETANAFAYRCLPLVSANTHGWEMLCPFGFEAVWRGGPGTADVGINVDPADAEEARRRPALVASHFGSGIVTFNPLVILRTAPGYNLWVAGPTNSFKHDIQAMSALVETDWMPFTFSVSWKLTRPGAPVRFEKGEPFCAFFPLARGVVASCEPRRAPVTDDPALLEQYQWARARRDLDTTLSDRGQDMFQSWYTRGELPDGAAGRAPDGHETHVTAKPFKR